MPARTSLVANEPQVLSTGHSSTLEQPVKQPLDTPAQSRKTSSRQLLPLHFFLSCLAEFTDSFRWLVSARAESALLVIPVRVQRDVKQQRRHRSIID